ncbi:hypothetical protein GCM10023167_06190 [Brevibacterium pityocampae]|uniref:ABC-2 type transport system permease protein n=1 Tax=Brevibacterium pityocampae TaxID=506594 RepID=A0ABP8J4T8_9MICO
MSTPASRLALLRRLHRQRSAAPSRDDLTVIAYAAVLLGLVLGVPLARGAVLLLASAEVSTALVAAAAPGWAGAAAAALLVAFALFGQVRGPVALAPFAVLLLARTDVPRRTALRRGFWASALAVIGVLLIVAGGVGGVLGVAAGVPVLAVVRLVIAAAGLGLICSVVWLAGQARIPGFGSGTGAACGALGVAVLVTASFAVPPLQWVAPWGWFGLTWPAAGPLAGHTGGVLAWLPVVLLCVLAGALALCVPRLLDQVGAEALAAQAARRQAAGAAAGTGDLTFALAAYRAVPVTGRGWRAVRARSTALRFLLRDLVGAARTPATLLVGAAGIAAAGALSVAAVTTAPMPAWVLAAPAAALLFTASGVLCAGFRHAAEAVGAPALYGYSTAWLYGLHALLPAGAAPVLAGAGAALTVLLTGAPADAGRTGVLAAVLLGVLAVAARAYDSAKGAMPVSMLTSSVPTPVGDPVMVLVVLWHFDAVLLTGAIGAVIVGQLVTDGAGPALALLGGTLATLLVLLRFRLGARAAE